MQIEGRDLQLSKPSLTLGTKHRLAAQVPGCRKDEGA
jgi:hypothetical protein